MCGKPMRGHCSARGQIGTGTVRTAFAGPAWTLHNIVGWVLVCEEESSTDQSELLFKPTV